MVPRVLSGVASEASGGGSCGATALGESTHCERGAEPRSDGEIGAPPSPQEEPSAAPLSLPRAPSSGAAGCWG